MKPDPQIGRPLSKKVNKKLSPLDSYIIHYRTKKSDSEDGDAENTIYGGYYL